VLSESYFSFFNNQPLYSTVWLIRLRQCIYGVMECYAFVMAIRMPLNSMINTVDKTALNGVRIVSLKCFTCILTQWIINLAVGMCKHGGSIATDFCLFDCTNWENILLHIVYDLYIHDVTRICCLCLRRN